MIGIKVVPRVMRRQSTHLDYLRKLSRELSRLSVHVSTGHRDEHRKLIEAIEWYLAMGTAGTETRQRGLAYGAESVPEY